MLTEAQIRELIAAIDRYHGNELKERTESSIADEVRTIQEFLDDVTWRRGS